MVSRNGCLGYSSLRGRHLKEKEKGVIQTAELTSSSMLLSYMITSTLYMMNSEGKHIYFLKMSLTKGSLTDFNCNLRQTRKTFVAVVAAG